MRAISVIGSVLLAFTVYAPVAAAGVVLVTINAPDRVLPGSSFTATVDIGEVVDLNAVQYEVVLDPSLLTVDNITAGKIGATAMPVQGFREVSPGRYQVLQYLMFTKVSGSGYLAVLHFRVVGSRGSSTTNLANGILSNWQAQEIPATWVGDSVSITAIESPGAGTPPPTTVPPSPALETPAPSAPAGSISQPSGNESSESSLAIVSAESVVEEVTTMAPGLAEEAPSPSTEAWAPRSSGVGVPSPSEAPPLPSPEAAPARPVNWFVIVGAIAGVLVVASLIFLQLRSRH